MATRHLRTAPLETPTGLKPDAVKDLSGALNLALAVLAIASTSTHSAAIDAAFVIIGGIGVALTMFRFSRPRPA